jgi:hypothetical protein
VPVAMPETLDISAVETLSKPFSTKRFKAVRMTFVFLSITLLIAQKYKLNPVWQYLGFGNITKP